MDQKIMKQIETIIFDLGGVLIDWNPRYVYRHMFMTEDAVEHFLSEICTSHWNEEQDAGRSFADATTVLIDKYPHYAKEITAYYGKWEHMLGDQIHGTVEILQNLKKDSRFRLYALTNWSAESFPVALEKFDFLHWFEGILVSGEEKMKKPDPAIFELMLERYKVDKDKALFIDDNMANVNAARNMGIESIQFTGSEQLKIAIENLGI